MNVRLRICLAVLAALAVTGCGGDDSSGSSGSSPTIVVTTNILGDVVREMTAGMAEVDTILPVGSSPHDFQPSARQVDAIRRADALVVNGGGFEAALVDTIEAARADGVPTHEAISTVDLLGAGHHDEGEDARAAGEVHDHDGSDPHFFTDPLRMVDAVEGIADFLAANLPELDDAAFRSRVDDYIDRLRSLDAEIEDILAPVPADRRVLVTNHEVFGYFADRYGFEIAGTVIPAGSTGDGVSAGSVAALAEVIEDRAVPAIFVETSASTRLAEVLAAEVGDQVEIVELFTESLGAEGSGAETYLQMLRTDAVRIAEATA